MRFCWLAFAIVSVAACATSGESEASSADASASESVYADSLPATDMGASRTNAGQPAYARQFVLEEEVIATTAQVTPEDVPVQRAPPATTDEVDIANTFTLQLAAVSTMEHAMDYAQQYGIDPSLAGVARILSNGQIYFVLAYGVYDSYETAEEASEELQETGVPKPWIRRLSSLEELSNAARASGL